MSKPVLKKGCESTEWLLALLSKGLGLVIIGYGIFVEDVEAMRMMCVACGSGLMGVAAHKYMGVRGLIKASHNAALADHDPDVQFVMPQQPQQPQQPGTLPIQPRKPPQGRQATAPTAPKAPAAPSAPSAPEPPLAPPVSGKDPFGNELKPPVPNPFEEAPPPPMPDTWGWPEPEATEPKTTLNLSSVLGGTDSAPSQSTRPAGRDLPPG